MRIFNGHSDLPTDIHYRRLAGEKDIFQRLYYPDFQKGNVSGAIFVIWTDEAHQNDSLGWSNAMIASFHEEIKENRNIMKQVLTFADYEKAVQEEKVGVILGLEGLPQIGSDISMLDQYYYEDGVRHVGLTWNEENALGKSWKYSGGLTQAGKEAVKRLEELGMIVDVSHLNDDGFWDVMRLAQGPIIASHSNSRALANYGRNLTDEMMRALKETGGLMGLNSAVDFIHSDKEKQDLEHAVIQLEHMVEIMGIDQVVFGFDFMEFLSKEAQGTLAPPLGETSTIPGLLSEKDIPNLLNAMRKRGFKEEDIEKIAYKNYEAYLKQILK